MKRFLADESLHGVILHHLRESGLEVNSVVDHSAGFSDQEFINLAKEQNAVLITDDKDFGEWVFAHGITDLTIVFLRYELKDLEQILLSTLTVLNSLANDEPEHCFVTIKKNRV